MTPQEELHKQLFSDEKVLVHNMDLLTLRAHREKLAEIAFKARARLTAVDDEIIEREKKGEKGKGFQRSVITDDKTSEAINIVRKRQSKQDKLRESLMGLMSPEDVEKAMSARNIKDTIEGQKLNRKKPEDMKAQPKDNPSEPFNPFAK